MTQNTIERPHQKNESEAISHLDLNRIKVSENLSDASTFELRTITPTIDRPVAVYMAAPKVESEDTMTGSFFAIKENAEAFWQNSPDSMGVIRSHSDGTLEQLGAGDDASMTGTFKVGRGEKVLMVTSQFIDTLKDKALFTKEGIAIALEDEDLRKEIIEISIDDAIDDSQPEAVQPVKESGWARRIRERAKQNAQKSNAEENTDQSASASPVSVSDPAELAMSAQAHQERAERAAELVQRMNAAPIDPEVELKEAARQAWARRRSEQKQAATAGDAPSEPVEEAAKTAATPNDVVAAHKKSRQSNDATPTEILDRVEGQAVGSAKAATTNEQTERSYKVFDQRKWSRVEVLGQEIGAHGRIDFKKEQPTVEEVVEAPKAEQTLGYEIITNPNNDPAIEQAISKLNSLRDAMADAVSGRRGRLFSFASKKRNELAKAYNDQIITLGQFANAESLSDDALTDSQKNLLVTKFVINEQMRLQAITKEKLKDTKANKLVEWMNIHGHATDETLDSRVIMQAIEQGGTGVDKFTLARRSMSQLYEKRIGNEQHEHRKKAARAVAIGAVAMASTVFGINPSMVGDAANNIFYGARKK